MAEFSMKRTVEILRERHQQPAYVEMTGGNVATIYAGPRWTQPDGEYTNTRYAVVAGPGLFDSESGHPADTMEFYIGIDDEGLSQHGSLDLMEYVSDEADAETIASTAARLIHERIRVNLLAVAGMANIANDRQQGDPTVKAADLSNDEVMASLRITQETERTTLHSDGKLGVHFYVGFTGWDATPYDSFGRVEEDVEAEDPMAVPVKVIDLTGTTVFTGMLDDSVGLPSGIYGVMTPNGRSLRVRIVRGQSANLTDDQPFVPGHPTVPMPDPAETFVTVNSPDDVDKTHVPIYEGPLESVHTMLSPGTYPAFLPEQDVEVGVRVKDDRTDLVPLAYALPAYKHADLQAWAGRPMTPAAAERVSDALNLLDTIGGER
jgi:hypothetical protein